MSRYVAQACQFKNCLRPATEAVERIFTSRTPIGASLYINLCDVHRYANVGASDTGGGEQQ